MKVLYIYRNPKLGYSVGKVFKPIEREMAKYADVDSIYMKSPGYGLSGVIRNVLYARKVIKDGNYDIVHITGVEHYLLPFLPKGVIKIITVHDMGTDQLIKKNLRTIWRYFMWYQSLNFAHGITYISNFSKNEANQNIKIDKKIVQVLIPDPIGVEFHYYPKTLNKVPVVLHIGTGKRKNLQSTIVALDGFQYKLRIIGKLDQEYLDLLKKYNVDYTNDHHISDEQVVQEYINCDIVDFPTKYEGFGMPTLEAQMTGRPVVTSNIPPMCDVAGEGAVLIDPYDISSIRKGYEYAVKNYSEIVEKGRINVQKYTIDKIVDAHLRNYRMLLENKS